MQDTASECSIHTKLFKEELAPPDQELDGFQVLDVDLRDSGVTTPKQKPKQKLSPKKDTR